MGNSFIIPKEYDEIRVIRFRPIKKEDSEEDYKIRLKLWFCTSHNLTPRNRTTTRLTTVGNIFYSTGKP